jgi:hypothetical protein
MLCVCRFWHRMDSHTLFVVSCITNCVLCLH